MAKTKKVKLPAVAKMARQKQMQDAAKNPFAKDFVKPGAKAHLGSAPTKKRKQ